MDGCLTEVQLYQAFRKETSGPELEAALLHILSCPLCHEQWKHFEVDEQVADGIRSAVLGDILAADAIPGVSTAMELPEQLSIPGFRLRGDYIEGGQAQVYRAIHEASQEEVAIKVFHNSPLNEGGYARFSRELQSLARLRHPHVIPIRSAGEIFGHAYYVMPWIEGLPLTEHIKRFDLTRKEKLELMIKVCSAVDHAHKRGVMHLDLKPSNVRVDRSGEPVVLDFGLARLASGEGQDNLGWELGIAGTPVYMAPEQVKEPDDVDTRADVFMLGLLFYEVLSGRRARRSFKPKGSDSELDIALTAPQPIREVLPKVGRELAAIIDTATSLNRESRYQNAEAFLDDLRRVCAGVAVQAMGDSPFYKITKFSRRYLAVVTGVISVLLILFTAMMVNRECQQVIDESFTRSAKWESGALNLKERQLNDARNESEIAHEKLKDAYEKLIKCYDELGQSEGASETRELLKDFKQFSSSSPVVDSADR